MSETQLASMYLGKPSFDDDDSRSQIYETSTMIHVLDGQEDVILDYITPKNIIDDRHKKSLEDTIETYEFIALGERRYAEFLEKRNRLIIPDEDGSLVEFVIFEAHKYRDRQGKKTQVYSHASYLELKKYAVIEPGTYEGTASIHAGRALNNTGWRVGLIESSSIRTIVFENYTNPFAYLRKLSNEFDLELRFRIEHDGSKITGRYVDLLEHVGEWRGREVEFGKDLSGIRRIEKQDVVTALLGIGPEDESGNRIEVLVEDEEALQRWGRIDEHGNLHHLIEPYYIESARFDMTEEEARQYTRTALDKRINTQVTYEADIIDLEHVPGMENKKIRFGDTIRIKDEKFNPPLYLEARVFEQQRSIKDKSHKTVKLGDFVEFTEDEVHDIWNQLREQIREKISQAELIEYTYDKLTIDGKDEAVRTDVESYAQTVSNDAKDEAITYTNNTVEPIQIAVDDIQGELEDQDDLISQAFTEITQAWDEIELKASQTEMDNANQQISNLEGQVTALAGEVQIKASQTEVDALEGRISTAESTLSVLPGQIELKANASDVYTKTEIDASFNALEGQIELKVDDGEARSIFRQEAGSFTFDADQINFEGHVFGQGATYSGDILGATFTARRFDRNMTYDSIHINDRRYRAYSRSTRNQVVRHSAAELDAAGSPFLEVDAKLTLSTWSTQEGSDTRFNEYTTILSSHGLASDNYYGFTFDVEREIILDTPSVEVKGDLEVNTSFGSGTFGAQTSSYFHMDTDRPAFHMGKDLTVDGSARFNGDVFADGRILAKDSLVLTLNNPETERMKMEYESNGSTYFRTLDASGTWNDRMYFAGRGAREVVVPNGLVTSELISDGEIYLRGASGTSNAFVINNDHLISSRQGNLTLYLNRAEGNFEIRSHSNKSGYRNDFWINTSGNVTVAGNFSVNGSKNAIVDTENYGKRLMYALETPDSRFMDVIETYVESGEYDIQLNKMFAETINGYTVLPVPQGLAAVKIVDIEKDKFRVSVESEEKVKVAFIVYGKRIGYEHEYMEKYTEEG